ncbi:phosphatase PAP2 family protein [Erysipelothrix sp. HDW6A]|uniref:phosphatase PAP2 family protein n=1 Tax=Erysipelothrix sp. HDW6A TaxID=2714928 RepID=UPI0014095A69|nr:phosphatase PAP2 family protein [Erysipelothrix sp. HDW6A]QIK56624.1 phosphatase PAP2 family protein [Erysipelothrix sp. HDW6A]
MELDILLWLQSLRTPLLDAFFTFYTRLGDHGELWILISALFLINKKTRTIGVLALLALVIEFVTVDFMLKPLVMRDRPFITHPLDILIEIPRGSSFPSGHTASSFAVAGVLLFNKIKGKWIAITLAAIMGLSRMYLFVHYPTDVLVGCIWGLIVAYGVTVVYRNKYHNVEKRGF